MAKAGTREWKDNISKARRRHNRISRDISGIVVYACGYCSKPCEEKPFCSVKCYGNYRRDFLPKEEQPGFGTGMPKEEMQRRIRTRSHTNHAIRDGKLVRGKCGVCGGVAEAHHLDYDDPLRVTWLCFKHHRAIHQHPDLLKKESP